MIDDEIDDGICFASVRDAVRWSEETALLSPMKNCLTSMLCNPGEGKLTREEVVDIAQTITALTNGLPGYGGAALTSVYSRGSDAMDIELGFELARRLRETDHGKQKKAHQLVDLGSAIVRQARYRELYARRYTMARMAMDVGVSRERFYKAEGWRFLRRQAKEELGTIIAHAELKLFTELASRGWMA